ncbi:CsbD family protein [Geitlerinema sp. P-1104]|uniref:CsbD family protein n=1 Tax=Geitlerinema sp. P-1104 TaxID=2546230 RepID=UPI001477264E|nr:CsbD family protein [Geitlerinema sp. P-1104]NMG60768.1 CsbD family protein [Geitlerinema sp. P-1104]
MISLRKITQVLLSAGLMMAIAVTANLGLGSQTAWAAVSANIAPNQIAWGFGNDAEADVKEAEGKVQESVGNVTGDPGDQLMGKAKQVEGQVRNAAEDVQDRIKERADIGLGGRPNVVQTNVQGNLKEIEGKVTDTPGDEIMGKAKQVESQVRNTVEDVKSAAQDLFN